MPHPRGHMFYIGLYRGKHEKSSCLKPRGLEPWYLVCSIIWWTSTQFVQIMPLGTKSALPRCHQGHGQLSTNTQYLHVSVKQNSGERFRATWPSCYKIESPNQHIHWMSTLLSIKAAYPDYTDIFWDLRLWCTLMVGAHLYTWLKLSYWHGWNLKFQTSWTIGTQTSKYSKYQQF